MLSMMLVMLEWDGFSLILIVYVLIFSLILKIGLPVLALPFGGVATLEKKI